MPDTSYAALTLAADIIRELRPSRTRADFEASTWQMTGITRLLIRCNELAAAEQISKARIAIPCVRTTGDEEWVARLSEIAGRLEGVTP